MVPTNQLSFSHYIQTGSQVVNNNVETTSVGQSALPTVKAPSTERGILHDSMDDEDIMKILDFSSSS